MKRRPALTLVKYFFFHVATLLVILIYLPVLLWTYCYSLHSTFVLTAALLASIFVLMITKSKRQAVRFLVVGLSIFILLIPFSLRQYNRRAESYQIRISNGQSLSKSEKLGIYCTLMFVTTFEYFVFHEAGVENLYLFFPVKNNVRIFHSESFLKSDVISAVVRKNKAAKIEWNKWKNPTISELRYSLAFDPCLITIKHYRGSREIRLTTNVQYREKYVTTHATKMLKGIFAFRVDEGLFWYLQKEKWIHSYTAIWIAHLDNPNN